MFSEIVEIRGKDLESEGWRKIMRKVLSDDPIYEIEELSIGNGLPNRARIAVWAPTREELDIRLEALGQGGLTIVTEPDVQTQPAPADGVFPEAFYSTTNFETFVRLAGEWAPVAKIEMDCTIVIDTAAGTACCVPIGSVKKGQAVVCGPTGVRIEQPKVNDRDKGAFEFMASDVSSEKSKLLVIREMALEIRAAKKAGQKILVVGGPAIIHTGAGPFLCRLIEGGYLDVLFAGNALATHDIEVALYGTSLGVNTQTGAPVPHGHEHHIRAINAIRAAGSIEAAVSKGLLTSGVMHACVTHNVRTVLAGSIRDDGPLPGVITDAQRAQDAMREALDGVGIAIMVATTLHSIATGNILPARVRCFCVDINPAVITKLADRGTHQSIGLVTDTEPFFKLLAEALEA